MSSSSFNEFSLQAKVIVLGDPKVGKSSLIHNLDPTSRPGIHTDDGFDADDIIFSVVEFPVTELIESGNDFVMDASNRVNKGRSQPSSSSMLPSSSTSLSTALPLSSTSMLPASKSTSNGQSVYLKIWEYTTGLSKEEEELAFRGALFCIAILDLRSPESAKNVFTKWIALKEKNMNECFLFVVGTHLDQVVQRRVDIAEICKACAQKEAIYTELSNFDGTNLSFLRRLMAQRINYVLSIRETVSNHVGTGGESERKGESPSALRGFEAEVDGDFSEEAKIQEHERIMQSLDGPLSAPFLEQDLICDSIGSILASALGTEYWPGFEVEEEHLTSIGKTLTGFLDKLTTDPKSLPKGPLDHSLLAGSQESIWERGGGVEGTDMYAVPEPDFEELQHVFEIMGFTLPQTLSAAAASALTEANSSSSQDKLIGSGTGPAAPTSPQDASSNGPSGTSSSVARKKVQGQQQPTQTKLRVRLPDGTTGIMIIYPGYEIKDQVDAFMVQYGMEDDKHSREKLIEAAISASKVTSSSAPSSPPVKRNSHSQPTQPSPLQPPAPIAAPEASEISGYLSSSTPSARRKSNLILGNAELAASKGPEISLKQEKQKSDPSTLANDTLSAAPARGSSGAPTNTTFTSQSKLPPRTPLMVPPPAQSSTSLTGVGTPTSSKRGVISNPGGTQTKPAKKCKIRIQLPDFAGGAIETVVREGQDLMEASKAIALEHNLSLGYQQKVYDQLRSAFRK